jgi:hypothetical protein
MDVIKALATAEDIQKAIDQLSGEPAFGEEHDTALESDTPFGQIMRQYSRMIRNIL